MERKKNFRKEFRDKYYVYYKENGSVKSPKLYRVCLGGTLILSICGLVLMYSEIKKNNIWKKV